MQPIEYIDAHFDDFLETLTRLSRIPSVSADLDNPGPVRESAEAVRAAMEAAGLENTRVLDLPGAHPYVYGDWLHAPGRPTLLLYAHHDVQPVGREDVWKTPPFEPVEKADGRLYGRGAADDKAGIVVHTSAIDAFFKAGKKPPLNLKVI